MAIKLRITDIIASITVSKITPVIPIFETLIFRKKRVRPKPTPAIRANMTFMVLV